MKNLLDLARLQIEEIPENKKVNETHMKESSSIWREEVALNQGGESRQIGEFSFTQDLNVGIEKSKKEFTKGTLNDKFTDVQLI